MAIALEFEEQKSGSAYASFSFGGHGFYYGVRQHEDEKCGLWVVDFGSFVGGRDETIVHICQGKEEAKRAAQKHLDDEVEKLSNPTPDKE